MSFYSDTTYWFLNIGHPSDYPMDQPPPHPPDWAEQKAKEWVAEAPEAREIVRSCGWAVMVRERRKNLLPAWRDFEGVAVAMLSFDDGVGLGMGLGMAAHGQCVAERVDQSELGGE